ncbi:unnamed protein product [Prorocentrum cordatum]|uniref:Uncharacterized protein n=1 Tax=Prorocentrum cordatum TaxID=2364126 RepID=A0ABN9VWH6_9DINO|nr:unnamed protein product [Polarella glacialis]
MRHADSTTYVVPHLQDHSEHHVEVFAAAALGLLNCLGFVVRSSNCCPPGDGYSRCEVWQDFRSMLSFLFGALVCCIVKNERDCDDSSPSAGKVQLDTCLL